MFCPVCKSNHFYRRHRTFRERLRCAAIYECANCHCRDVESYLEHFPMFSRTARCPECSNTALRVQLCPDPVERLLRHPLSYFQKVLKAPLLYCPYCRLQFYDWRPLHAPAPQPGRQSAAPLASGRSESLAPARGPHGRLPRPAPFRPAGEPSGPAAQDSSSAA